MNAEASLLPGLLPPSPRSVICEAIGLACKRLAPPSEDPLAGGLGSCLREDGSAVLAIRERDKGFGEAPRLVRITIRVKEAPTDVQAIETTGPRAA